MRAVSFWLVELIFETVEPVSGTVSKKTFRFSLEDGSLWRRIPCSFAELCMATLFPMGNGKWMGRNTKLIIFPKCKNLARFSDFVNFHPCQFGWGLCVVSWCPNASCVLLVFWDYNWSSFSGPINKVASPCKLPGYTTFSNCLLNHKKRQLCKI